MQSTSKKMNLFLPFVRVDPQPIIYDKPQKSYELNDISNALDGSVELTAEEKLIGTISATHLEIIFNSELNEIFSLTKKSYPAGTHFSEKPTNVTKIDIVHLKYNCVDGSIVNGRPESRFSYSSFNVPPGFKISKEPTSIWFIKVNKGKIGDLTFYHEVDGKNIVDFSGETVTFTLMV